MNSGQVGNQIYGGERCEKKLGNGESGAGADSLGGSCRRIALAEGYDAVKVNPLAINENGKMVWKHPMKIISF